MPAALRRGKAREAGGMAEHVGSTGSSGAQRRGDPLAFLQGGGELGALIRAKDWSGTPLGPPESWPQSLKTTLGIVLNSRYPMFVFWGPELVKIYNDGYRPITGHKHPWALGRPAREVWPEIWRDIEPLVARALAGDPTYSDDLLLVMERSGFREEVYFTFSYSPVPDESGGIGGMFCACTETTARVIGERRLRTLRDLAASPADARTAGAACTLSIDVLGANAADVPFALIYLLDDGGAALLVAATGVRTGSAAAPLELTDDDAWPVHRVTGTREPELIAAAADRVGPIAAGPWPEPPTEAMVLPIVDRGLDRGVGALVLGISARRPFDAEYRRWFELVAAQIGASITNARAADEERRRADALADLDRVKTAFFSNVSHEFRTPLTLMLGPLEEALATEGLPEAARESLDLARRNSQRLLKLVNSLLDFSRLEAGRLQAATEPLDLGTLTSEIAGVFRSTIEAAGLRYDVDAPPLADRIPVDREMWEKIVLNLVSNAFKFTLAGGIGVRVAREGGDVVLTVTDTGIGIPETELPHVFDRFHRVRGAGGRSYEGSGIGLALVRELVRLHHGEVSVASTPGAGSTFRVSLPIGEAAGAAAHGETRHQARPADPVHGDAFVEEAARWIAGTGVAAGAASAERPRILLADDNADMRDYVARLLAPSCRVDAVADGAAALAALRTHPPDLILADIMMPRVDGLELLRAVRSDPALRRIPVILVSARAGDEARVEGMQAGADDYLVKPFGARELLARVAAALQLARVRREGEERLAEANRALRERVAELETLLSVIPVGIGISLDRECRNVQVNPAFAAMLGLASGQNASKTAPEGERPTSFRILDLQGNEVPGDRLPLQVAAREGREVNHLELDIVHDDGRTTRLLEYAAPLLDEHGTPRGSIGAFVDITQRRRAERRDSFLVALDDAVRASDDPRAMLLAACRLLAAELAADRCAYASVDADGDEFTVVHEHRVEGAEPSLIGAWTLSGFSDAFAGQLRAGRTLVVGDYAAELPDDAGTFASLGIAASVIAATLREGRLVALLSVHHGAPRRWRAGEIELVEMTANRCWESIARARAVRALEASERRYRVVADAMPQLVWTAGPDGTVDYYSARARNYEGIQPGDGSNDWQPMVHPDDVAPTLAAWTRAMRERTPYAFEHRLKMATGEYRWHLSRAEPVQLEGTGTRERFRWIGTATDVHELRLSQERLRVHRHPRPRAAEPAGAAADGARAAPAVAGSGVGGGPRPADDGAPGHADGAADRRPARRVAHHLGQDPAAARADAGRRPGAPRARRPPGGLRRGRPRGPGRAAGGTALRQRRSGAVRPDPLQPAAQRAQVHRPGRERDGDRRGGRRRSADAGAAAVGQRHRRRHPGRRPAAHLRALRPGSAARVAGTRRARHRPGAGAAPRRAARRPAGCGERRPRARRHVHAARAPARPRRRGAGAAGRGCARARLVGLPAARRRRQRGRGRRPGSGAARVRRRSPHRLRRRGRAADGGGRRPRRRAPRHRAARPRRLRRLPRHPRRHRSPGAGHRPDRLRPGARQGPRARRRVRCPLDQAGRARRAVRVAAPGGHATPPGTLSPPPPRRCPTVVRRCRAVGLPSRHRQPVAFANTGHGAAPRWDADDPRARRLHAPPRRRSCTA
jgi:signal transduction histidine kinase/PAS domain-containing protein